MGPVRISKARKESKTGVPALGSWRQAEGGDVSLASGPNLEPPTLALNLGMGTLRTQESQHSFPQGTRLQEM